MSWGLIAQMGYVSIQTTDLEASVADATTLLGLHVNARTDRAAYLAAAEVHHELSYHGGDRNGVDRIGLVASSPSSLRQLYDRVKGSGLPILSREADGPGVAEAFSFLGPEGYVFEVYTGMEHLANPLGRGASGPDRYGHLNLHPQDVVAFKDFLVTVLGFRLSDVIGDDFAYFLRCNSDHHGIALIKGRGTMHHHAWQVQSATELTKVCDRVGAAGREIIWGPVRHGAGHNIACYYVEASGAVVEIYADLEQIYDDERPPVLWGAEDNWYSMWSDFRPESFRMHGLGPAPLSAAIPR
jgi:catechol 2,3-dioxygenase-like lactoylglutathione lyase family enzyme